MDGNETEFFHSLNELYIYLEHVNLISLDLFLLKEDIINGLYFKSNIPIGYGLGSSGALCAGILDKYKTEEVNDWDLIRIQKELGKIESYFHGKSSGFDPLISYLNKTILVRESGSLEIIEKSVRSKGLYIYLLDSGIPRKTESLVNSFIASHQDSNKLEVFKSNYISIVKSCIEGMTSGKLDILSDIKKLSLFQFDYFVDYIPKDIHNIWKESLDKDDLAIKLCGAGGGGFFLLFSNKIIDSIQGFKLIRIKD